MKNIYFTTYLVCQSLVDASKYLNYISFSFSWPLNICFVNCFVRLSIHDFWCYTTYGFCYICIIAIAILSANIKHNANVKICGSVCTSLSLAVCVKTKGGRGQKTVNYTDIQSLNNFIIEFFRLVCFKIVLSKLFKL